MAFCSFLVLYSITTVATYTKEDFGFDTWFYFIVTNKGGGGVTTEEKERLLKEYWKDRIVRETPINE